MSIWNKIKYLNLNIFRTRCCKPLIFQTLIIWSNRIHSLKYLRSATFCSKDIVIRKSKFVAKTQFLLRKVFYKIRWWYEWYIKCAKKCVYTLKFKNLLSQKYFYKNALWLEKMHILQKRMLNRQNLSSDTRPFFYFFGISLTSRGCSCNFKFWISKFRWLMTPLSFYVTLWGHSWLRSLMVLILTTGS